MRTGIVIVAAGHGVLRPEVSKLVEYLDSNRRVTIIGSVARSISSIHQAVQVFVLNRRFSEQVRQAIPPAAYDSLRYYVEQPRRNGAADAVRHALPLLLEKQCTEVVVVFGDMPLWRAATVTRLLHMHRRTNAVITMTTVTLPEQHAVTIDVLERYGRVLFDASGNIVQVIEPGEANELHCQVVRHVNPSLYVFNLQWLVENIDSIEPQYRQDGYGEEYHLPRLIPIAAQQGVSIVNMSLRDPEEALGVNTLEDLSRVQEVWQRRTRRNTKKNTKSTTTPRGGGWKRKRRSRLSATV